MREEGLMERLTMNVRRNKGHAMFLYYISYVIPKIGGAGRIRLSYMVADSYFLTYKDD